MGVSKVFWRVLHFINHLYLCLILKFLPIRLSAGCVRCFWLDEGLWGHRLGLPLRCWTPVLWLQLGGSACSTCCDRGPGVHSSSSCTHWVEESRAWTLKTYLILIIYLRALQMKHRFSKLLQNGKKPPKSWGWGFSPQNSEGAGTYFSILGYFSQHQIFHSSGQNQSCTKNCDYPKYCRNGYNKRFVLEQGQVELVNTVSLSG